jgi:hypothetical protein
MAEDLVEMISDSWMPLFLSSKYLKKDLETPENEFNFFVAREPFVLANWRFRVRRSLE